MSTQSLIESLTADVAAVVPVLPQLLAAYNAFKTIWTVLNPGKTEADFEAYLVSASQTNITDADVILLKDGYVKGPDGKWSKP